jgi:hypothetical protein
MTPQTAFSSARHSFRFQMNFLHFSPLLAVCLTAVLFLGSHGLFLIQLILEQTGGKNFTSSTAPFSWG